jgi:hypothetical protein
VNAILSFVSTDGFTVPNGPRLDQARDQTFAATPVIGRIALTTQWLLDKAGPPMLDLYRSIDLHVANERTEEV